MSVVSPDFAQWCPTVNRCGSRGRRGPGSAEPPAAGRLRSSGWSSRRIRCAQATSRSPGSFDVLVLVARTSFEDPCSTREVLDALIAQSAIPLVRPDEGPPLAPADPDNRTAPSATVTDAVPVLAELEFVGALCRAHVPVPFSGSRSHPSTHEYYFGPLVRILYRILRSDCKSTSQRTERPSSSVARKSEKSQFRSSWFPTVPAVADDHEAGRPPTPISSVVPSSP